jgi:hypothetical protein
MRKCAAATAAWRDLTFLYISYRQGLPVSVEMGHCEDFVSCRAFEVEMGWKEYLEKRNKKRRPQAPL